MKQIAAGTLALILSGCSEPKPLARKFSPYVEEITSRVETKAKQITKEQKDVTSLVQKLKEKGEYQEGVGCILQKTGELQWESDLCVFGNDPANRYDTKFQDKLYYQWEAFISDLNVDGKVDLVIAFNYKGEYDLFSRRNDLIIQQYFIIDDDANLEIDKVFKWELQNDTLLSCNNGPDNPDERVCKNPGEIEKFGLPSHCRLEYRGSCVGERKYNLPVDSTMRYIYSTLVTETLKALDGAKPELPPQFTSAWEYLKGIK